MNCYNTYNENLGVTMKKIVFILLFTLISQNILFAEYLENANPPAKDFDWMELESGEWLKGEFKGMYSGDVEFDSDEFDLVTFDIGDVKQIITKGNSVISLNRELPSITKVYSQINDKDTEEKDEQEVLGHITYKDKSFSITLADGTVRPLATSDIASIAGGEPKESNYWSAKAFLGFDTLSGNTEQITATAKANVERRTVLTRFMADYLATHTVVDGDLTTADNDRANSSFDLYQTAHFYWRLASLQYLRDPFQNIRGRYTYAVGIGYDIIYTPKTDWSITMGPGYQYTRYDDYNKNDTDSVKSASTPMFFLDSRFNTEITNDIDFIFNYNIYAVNKDSGQYVHHAEVSLETELVSDFTVDFSVFWDRTQEPNSFADGTYPLKSDYKSMLAIGYSY